MPPIVVSVVLTRSSGVTSGELLIRHPENSRSETEPSPQIAASNVYAVKLSSVHSTIVSSKLRADVASLLLPCPAVDSAILF